MNNKWKIAIAIIIVLIVGVGIWAYFNNKASADVAPAMESSTDLYSRKFYLKEQNRAGLAKNYPIEARATARVEYTNKITKKVVYGWTSGYFTFTPTNGNAQLNYQNCKNAISKQAQNYKDWDWKLAGEYAPPETGIGDEYTNTRPYDQIYLSFDVKIPGPTGPADSTIVPQNFYTPFLVDMTTDLPTNIEKKRIEYSGTLDASHLGAGEQSSTMITDTKVIVLP